MELEDNNKFPKYFETIEKYFILKFSFFSNEDTLTTSEKKKWESIHSKKIEKTIFDNVIEITILNPLSYRKLFFSFYEGYNASVEKYNSIVFTIENTSESNKVIRNKFSIEEYFKQQKIDFDNKSFYPSVLNVNPFHQIKKYLDDLVEIINSSSLKTILNGQVWEDVKIDMSPYK